MKRLFFGAYLLVAFLLCATSGVYADSWQLLTDAASLKAGDKLILACPDKGMTAGVLNESKGYLEAVSSRFSLNTSSVTDLGEGTLVFTLGGSEGQWTLTGPDGRMLGAKETKSVSYDGYVTTWDITVSEDGATVFSTSSSYGRFLYNVNNPRFTTYTSAISKSMLLPRLYRFVPSPQYTFMYDGYSGYTVRCEGGGLHKEGESVALSPVAPVRENYTFLGWQYGGAVYQPGDVFLMPAADVALIPLWKQIPTRVEDTADGQKVLKIVRDGSVYIVRDGKTYDVIGREQ